MKESSECDCGACSCDNGIYTICGIKYTKALFEAWAEGGILLNKPFVIVKREDGVIAIQNYEE